MADTTEIMKTLKWWNAERFKTLQRKLTAAKNTIQTEALSPNFLPFFSADEIDTLKEAVRILGSTKRKIEHAKEIKVREEKARDIRLEKCKHQRLALLIEAIPKAESEGDVRSILLWILSLSLHSQEISSHAYFYDNKYISGDIDRAFDTKSRQTVLGEANKWRREITEFLEENLWPDYDIAPDPKRLERIVGLVKGAWGERALTHASTQSLIERFDTELAIQKSQSVHRI